MYTIERKEYINIRWINKGQWPTLITSQIEEQNTEEGKENIILSSHMRVIKI